MLEVQPHLVTVLADTALRAKDIDEAAALEAKQRAEKMLADRNAEIDYSRAHAELAEAMAQLQALRITSYNVCYTKLLRLLTFSKFI